MDVFDIASADPQISHSNSQIFLCIRSKRSDTSILYICYEWNPVPNYSCKESWVGSSFYYIFLPEQVNQDNCNLKRKNIAYTMDFYIMLTFYVESET